MGNMREISIEECRRVSGGIIIVNGSPPGTPPNPGPDNTALEGASMYLGMNSTTINYSSLYGQGQTLSENPEVASDFEDGEVDEGDDDGDGILNRDEEIVVHGSPPAAQTSLPVSYFGFSGAMGLGIGFSFIHNGQTGEWDVDAAGTAGLGFFVEGGVASDTKTAQEQSEATKNGWTVTGGKAGGSAGGGSGDGTSIGAQVGAGAIITDTDIIP